MKRPILLALLIILVFSLSQFIFIINEGEQAIVTQFGKPKRTIVDSGLKLKIPFIETDNVVFDNLEKGIKQNIDLSEIDEISFSKKKVEIQFEVEKFTEKIIELSLIAVNVPKEYKIKFYPPKVEIVTTVAFEDYDKLNSTLFIAKVDASQLEGKNKLDISLSKQPTFANIVKIKPSRVEFLLIRE